MGETVSAEQLLLPPSPPLLPSFHCTIDRGRRPEYCVQDTEHRIGISGHYMPREIQTKRITYILTFSALGYFLGEPAFSILQYYQFPARYPSRVLRVDLPPSTSDSSVDAGNKVTSPLPLLRPTHRRWTRPTQSLFRYTERKCPADHCSIQRFPPQKTYSPLRLRQAGLDLPRRSGSLSLFHHYY
ncbi:hypothetical protein I7I50_08120 [Histoplasma capsulatum G186AR]|uniref:Uncharacterized protein n=1 Tax=Ajellomyces capsulatus TaxID=5037 RepID=A0A8H7YFB4_AJECA|nr:hypothetical protein I7I52_08636 [Histoplasma capsulatum]QSS68642.1 hypothetical protein I7I50_08120 [Histoplasma capsulatum G186AR]